MPDPDGQIQLVASRRASISDVAVRAGVSKAAVSKVIREAYGVSPAMRARVEKAIDELNYRPRVAAQALRGSSFTVGFEIPHLGNDFFNQVVSGATTGLAASKYQLIVAPGLGYRGARSVLEALIDRQVDGIITISSEVAPDWLEQLAVDIPIVLLGRHDDSSAYDTVTGDDQAGADLVMDHLLQLGHERIAHLTMRPRAPESPHDLRLSTYIDRMKAIGRKPQVVYTETEHESFEATRALLAGSKPPTAIFAGHDALAIAALGAVAQAGRSAEVSVVGYDNIDLARHPLISLTTVDHFGVDMGMAATALLMERIRDGRRTTSNISFDPQLRVRSTTRPPSS